MHICIGMCVVYMSKYVCVRYVSPCTCASNTYVCRAHASDLHECACVHAFICMCVCACLHLCVCVCSRVFVLAAAVQRTVRDKRPPSAPLRIPLPALSNRCKNENASTISYQIRHSLRCCREPATDQDPMKEKKKFLV